MKSLPPILTLVFSFLLFSCSKEEDQNQTVTPPAPLVPVPTAVGTATGTPVSVTLNQAGGTLVSSDGLFEVIVPPNALTSSVTLSVQTITNECHSGITHTGYRLTPDGQIFDTLITLRYHYNTDSIRHTDPKAMRMAFQRSDATWVSFKEAVIDTANKTLESQTKHFTDYTIFTRWDMIPVDADVEINKTKELIVRVIHTEDLPGTGGGGPGDEVALSQLVGQMQEAVGLEAQISNWSVNGTIGGNSTDGIIVKQQVRGLFTAPANVPSNNPVAVSVEIDISPDPGKLRLVSNLTIKGSAGYRLEMTDNYSFANVICYCQIPNWYDKGSIEFEIDNNDLVVEGAIQNQAPVFSFVSTPPGICMTVTNNLGTIDITGIVGYRTTTDSLVLDLYYNSEVTAVTSQMLGTPCNSSSGISPASIHFNNFSASDSLQTLPGPFGTEIKLIKLN